MQTIPDLRSRTTPGATVEATAPGRWRLTIPSGSAESYRLAQLDDCAASSRRALPWRPPLRLELQARVSAVRLPGTWGFGLWNDPFALRIGLSGATRRLPALPQAAWFFHAPPPNYLALWDTHAAQGLLAATFRSLDLPAPLLALGFPALPLLAWPWAARCLRGAARLLVHEYASALRTDPTAWHCYTLDWRTDHVQFHLDGALCGKTDVVPRPPLGLVLWIDNQYASFPPTGRLSFGRLPTPAPACLELADMRVEPL